MVGGRDEADEGLLPGRWRRVGAGQEEVGECELGFAEPARRKGLDEDRLESRGCVGEAADSGGPDLTGEGESLGEGSDDEGISPFEGDEHPHGGRRGLTGHRVGIAAGQGEGGERCGGPRVELQEQFKSRCAQELTGRVCGAFARGDSVNGDREVVGVGEPREGGDDPGPEHAAGVAAAVVGSEGGVEGAEGLAVGGVGGFCKGVEGCEDGLGVPAGEEFARKGTAFGRALAEGAEAVEVGAGVFAGCGAGRHGQYGHGPGRKRRVR